MATTESQQFAISTESTDEPKTFENEQEFWDTKALLDENGVDYEVLHSPEEPENVEEPEELENQGEQGESEMSDDTPEFDGRDDPDEEPQEVELVDGQTLPDHTIEDDPVEWLPEHFIDVIRGVPTVNRKGYAVIAAEYNVSVTAEPVTLASQTDFEYAEFKATAVSESGQEYSGFGSAHIEREDGDDPYLLNELAETRALKRACAWATGVGMTAIEELEGGRHE